jgi:hypothetical protein
MNAKKRNSPTLRWMLCLLFAGCANAADTPEGQIKVDDSSFRCITEMTSVKHFYVDNLLGNLEATVAVAKAGSGEYPVGSVLQLMPNEVMVKHGKGFSPATRDWEFFWIDVSKEGQKTSRAASPRSTIVCENDHGCDPIPVTRAMFGALQRTDARCKGSENVSAEDQESLKQLDEIVKALAANSKKE